MCRGVIVTRTGDPYGHQRFPHQALGTHTSVRSPHNPSYPTASELGLRDKIVDRGAACDGQEQVARDSWGHQSERDKEPGGGTFHRVTSRVAAILIALQSEEQTEG